MVDTCGTGGDGGGTFNISTTTAFVVAGSGVTVAKHGNRSVSSRCGSADLVEALGVNITVDPFVVEEAVAEIGIGFLFAPLYHGAMKHAAAARKEVGIRSIFNMLGPLTNPAGANCQLLGVYAPQLTEMFAEALRLLGTRRALVVHGHDGLDEISVCAPTRVTELRDGLIRTYDIDPERFLGRRAAPAEVAGGRPGPQRRDHPRGPRGRQRGLPRRGRAQRRRRPGGRRQNRHHRSGDARGGRIHRLRFRPPQTGRTGQLHPSGRIKKRIRGSKGSREKTIILPLTPGTLGPLNP